MIRLDNTTRKLQILLGGAVATTELSVAVSYSDKTSTTYNGATTVSNTSGATPVDICAAPAASTIRDIDYINVVNRDTTNAAVTIRYNDNGTTYNIITATLASGEQLEYTHGSGWKSLSTNGEYKQKTVATVTAGIGGIGAGGNTATSGTVTFGSSAGNVTFGMDGAGYVTASAPAGGGGGIAIGAGTQTATTNTVNFANSNGISFGMSGSTQVTASYTVPDISPLQYTSNTSAITSNAFPSADTTKFAGTGTSATNASITLNSNGLAISVAAPGGGGGGVALSAGTNSTSTGTVVFSNSNNISFGMNTNSVVTANAAINVYVTGNTTNSSSSSWDVSSLKLSGFGNMSIGVVGTPNPYLIFSVRDITVSASNTFITNLRRIDFENSNGISFSASTGAGSISIRASHNGLTTAAQSDHSHGNPTLALINLTGTTASNSAGFTLSLSAAAGGGGADGYNILAAGTQTATTAGTVKFENSNGITFGMSNSTQITASHNAFPSADTTKFAGTGTSATNASITLNSNGLAISIGAGGAADGYNSAQFTNSTANSTMPILWAGNSNGSGNLTLGLTGSTMTGVAGFIVANDDTTFSGIREIQFPLGNLLNTVTTYADGGVAAVLLDFPPTTPLYEVWGNNSTATTFLDADTNNPYNAYNIAGSNISFRVTGSAAGVSNSVFIDAYQNVSAANGSYQSSQVKFANSNGVSFSTGTQGVYATVATNYLITAAQSNHSHNLATTTTNGSQIVIATTNSAGATMAVPPFITTYVNDLTSGRAGTGFTSTTTGGTAVVGTLNTNGLSLGIPAYITTAAGGGGTQSLYAVSNTTQSSSGTYTNGLSFAGAGIASVGVTNGSVVVSVPSGGGADGYNIVSMGTSGNTTGTGWSSLSASIGIYGGNNITVSQNNSNQLVISAPSGGGLGVSSLGNTAGSTGMVSDNMVFVGSNGISLSQSTNGQSATITIRGDGATYSNYMPHMQAMQVVGQIGQNTLHIQPLNNCPVVSFDRMALLVHYTQSTASTLTLSVSVMCGIYSKNASTLSLISSFSGSFSVNGSGTASSGQNSGNRWATFTVNNAMSFGGQDLWFGMASSTATAGGANVTLSNLLVSQINSTMSGFLGVASTVAGQRFPGLGVYSVSTGGIPSAISITQINGNSSAFQRQPIFMLSNGAFV